MNKYAETIFTDESLHFLYSSPMFNQLSETAQRQFFATFEQHESLAEILAVAADLYTSVQEVEAIVPPMIQSERTLSEIEVYHQQLKAGAKQQDNVIFVPFGQRQASPFVVLLQHSESMAAIAAYMKGLILPLFNLCAKQNRDLIILPFAEQPLAPFVFERGLLNVQAFAELIDLPMTGEANLLPAMEQAYELFAQDAVQQSRELFIVTNNDLCDVSLLQESDYLRALAKAEIELSIIAQSEKQFALKPIPFAQKVYFVEDEL